MFSGIGSLVLLVVCSYITLAACLPLDVGISFSTNQSITTSRNPSHANVSSLSLGTLGDWVHFSYPILNTNQVLKGQIFTSRPLRARALHYVIDGALAFARRQMSSSGNTALQESDNPFIYRIPGCYFKMGSKLRVGKPIMTYKMMIDTLDALHDLLETQQMAFDTTFSLTDKNQKTWGHGEIFGEVPNLLATTS